MLKYTYSLYGLIDFSFFCLWCFNATFGNISAISWRSVLVLEEAGVPGENHRPWASNKKKNVVFVWFCQIQCSVLSMYCRQFWWAVLRCSSPPSQPLSQLFSHPPARRLSVFASFKKESSYGHVPTCIMMSWYYMNYLSLFKITWSPQK